MHDGGLKFNTSQFNEVDNMSNNLAYLIDELHPKYDISRSNPSVNLLS